MRRYSVLVERAIQELKNNDELFCGCVNELDSWNGFADGFRCYPMYELDELFYDCKVSDFLDKLGSHFNHTDNFMVDTIYGLESVNDETEVYRDNVDEGELLDNLIENYNHIDIEWISPLFDSMIQDIINIIAETEKEA